MAKPSIIYTHYSNCTEALVEALVNVVADQLDGPFCPETIVVQGPGMAAYLTQQLACALGVWANGDFIFPRHYMERCVDAVLGTPSSPAVTEEQLTWLVLAELQRSLHEPPFVRLAYYLRDDPRGTKRFQLARRIGTLFDRYITFRPEMMRAWSRGQLADVDKANQWQPALWRRIEPAFVGRHFAAVESQWHERAAGLAKRPEAMAARVCVFGICSLPPPYVRLLAACSRWVQTHVFIFSPSDKDWWNGTTRVQWAAAVSAGHDPEALFMDTGHPLISSCGSVGADFRRVWGDSIEEMGLSEAVEEIYVRPVGDRLLSRLQGAIFDLNGPGEGPARQEARWQVKGPAPTAQLALPFFTAPSKAPSPHAKTPDASVAVHACHSPMREVEVCRDQLLALMTRPEDSVAPHEIVVMMADVETYAPFVEAVFGEDPSLKTHIPFRIADRTLRADSPVVDAFFRALDLVGSRMSAAAVIDLITASAIEQRLALAGADLERLTEWIVAAGVRWGLDAEHRQQHGQPPHNQNTWRFGLDRLLLGYAMPSFGKAVFAGVLPYDEIEGQQAADLGLLSAFLETLFFHLRHLEAPRTVLQWRIDLLAFLSAVAGEAADADWQHQHIRQALAGLQDESEAAGFAGEVDLAVMRAWLEERVESALPERGFLAGGVTFCAMVPMRSIPFRVVCLLGLSDGAFPRSTRAAQFDLLAQGPGRPGDRDRRLDDRYLFLETLCAAREFLIVTYTGQSVRDNAVRPPSVLVSELLDALSTPDMTREQVEQAVVVRHPLQGFSRRYFTGEDSRLWSYARGFSHMDNMRQAPLQAPPAFARQLLPPIDEPQVLLADLQRFWADPLRFFLTRRVRVDFPEFAQDVPGREPIELDPLQRYDVGSRVLAGLDDPRSRQDAAAVSHATGLLPYGSLGRFYFDNVCEQAETIAAVAKPLMKARLASIHFDHLLGNNMRLVGTLDGLFTEGAIHRQFGRIKPSRQMRAWVSHLVLCLLGPPNVARETVVIGRSMGVGPAVLRFAPVAEPLPLLQDLIFLFTVGLQGPLRFQADASLAFVAGANKGSRKPPLERAVDAYAEARKFLSHWRRVAGDDIPPFETLATQGPTFEALAHRVLEPMMSFRTICEGAEVK